MNNNQAIKVLLQTYNTCFQNSSGGVNVRFNKIYNELLKHGVDVKKFDKYVDKVENFDVLHIFHLDLENLELIKYAKRLGKKVVISSVVNIIGRKKLLFYRFINIFHLQTYFKNYRLALSLADIIIAETPDEKKFIAKYYKINPDKIYVIPNGIDEFECQNELIFDLWSGRKQEYVLQIGRFDKNKNQLNVIKAFRNSDVQVVFVGGPSKAEPNYYKKCLKAANKSYNFHFLGWVDHESETFKSALFNASVLVLPSYMETFGMVLIEGAAAGASISISKTLPILKYKVFSNCPSFNPNNPNDIKCKTMTALNHPQTKLKEQVISFFSWDRIIKEHINIYNNLLGHVKNN